MNSHDVLASRQRVGIQFVFGLLIDAIILQIIDIIKADVPFEVSIVLLLI